MELFWLDDDEMIRISRLAPSTQFGLDLMRDAWPKRFPTVISSPTYRGYAMALSALASMGAGASVAAIEQMIERVDQAYKNSKYCVPGNDLAGGIGLAIANSWQDAHSVSLNLFAAKTESELIYAAKMFVAARGLENSGKKLA
jgi:hypothetical protein